MIAHTFDEAFSLVGKLVEDFRRNEAQFLSPAYNETAVREVFINRFWMALGWDVTHETQKNPYECEVTVERKCANLDGQIDALVYELYGLTPQEIALVEAS